MAHDDNKHPICGASIHYRRSRRELPVLQAGAGWSGVRCRFEIGWPEGVKTKSMGGVDEVQALLLAMRIARTDLLSARENDGREVLYLDQRDLDLPFAESIRDWVSKG